MIGLISRFGEHGIAEVHLYPGDKRWVRLFPCSRKPDGGIEYEQHQGNGIRVNGFECRYVSLLNQRSVQRTAGKGLTILFVLV